MDPGILWEPRMHLPPQNFLACVFKSGGRVLRPANWANFPPNSYLNLGRSSESPSTFIGLRFRPRACPSRTALKFESSHARESRLAASVETFSVRRDVAKRE